MEISVVVLGAALVAVAVLAAAAGVAVALRLGGRRDDDATLVASLRTELDEQRRTLEEQRDATVRAAIESAVVLTREQLGAQLSLGDAALQMRNVQVGERIDAMGTAVGQLAELVRTLDAQRERRYGELSQRLEQASRATSELSQTTESLRQALASPTRRGQWGERMAEDVLRTAGFVEGVSYLKQTNARSGRPDYTFLLPTDRKVHMDVKFPLDNYLRWLDAGSDVERDHAIKAFRRDVRMRVRELAARDYVDLGDGTLAEVLLFLPNEQLHAFIHEHDPDLLDVALQQRVVLCSPTTLFAVLAVIRQAVDDHMLEVQSGRILDVLADFRQQWEKLTDRLDTLGKQLGTAQRTFDDVNGTRRRMLEKQIDRVDDLRREREGEAGGAVLALPDRPRHDARYAGDPTGSDHPDVARLAR